MERTDIERKRLLAERVVTFYEEVKQRARKLREENGRDSTTILNFTIPNVNEDFLIRKKEGNFIVSHQIVDSRKKKFFNVNQNTFSSFQYSKSNYN